MATEKYPSDEKTEFTTLKDDVDPKIEQFYEILMKNDFKYDLYFLRANEEIKKIRYNDFPPIKKYIETIYDLILKSDKEIMPFFIKNRDLILDLLVEHCPELNLKILEKILSEKKKFTIIRFSSYNNNAEKESIRLLRLFFSPKRMQKKLKNSKNINEEENDLLVRIAEERKYCGYYLTHLLMECLETKDKNHLNSFVYQIIYNACEKKHFFANQRLIEYLNSNPNLSLSDDYKLIDYSNSYYRVFHFYSYMISFL